MTTLERRDLMLDAVEGSDGFVRLRVVVQGLADNGVEADVLLEDLDQIRKLVSEEDEDKAMDVMDLIVGYCADSARIRFPRIARS